MANYTVQDIRIGLNLNCNGYPGTITEIHTGVLAGMATVRLNSGTVCASISELIRFQNVSAA